MPTPRGWESAMIDHDATGLVIAVNG